MANSSFFLRSFLLAATCLCGSVLLPAAAEARGDALTLQRRITDLYEAQAGAVVRVKAAFEEEDENGQQRVTVKYGTGFFISREGHLLANASRAYGADRIWIEHRGLSYPAEAVGHDFYTNVALLQALALPEDFDFLRLPDEAGLPPVGSLALMISCPLEFEPSPSLGLISGHESHFFQQIFPTTCIRSSIPAGMGEGGAPILALNGRLLGIVFAGLADIPGSYILPARAAKRIRDDLLFQGEVAYAWMGFDLKPRLSGENRAELVIDSISAQSPAEKAGLRTGDVLVSLGGEPMANLSAVRDSLFYARPQEYLDVEVLRTAEGTREEERLVFSVQLSRRPAGEMRPPVEGADGPPAEPETSEAEETAPEAP